MKPTLRVIDKKATQTLGTAEYLWIEEDGQLRHKTRSILVTADSGGDPLPIIEWWTTTAGREGGATPISGPLQLLLPAHYVPNPLRPNGYVVLCEVRDLKDRVVPWNTRAPLRDLEATVTAPLGVWLGLEVALSDGMPLQALEEHMAVCLDAGLFLHSYTAMCGSYKLGPRGSLGDVDFDPPSPLIVCDHYWIARYFLKALAGKYDAPVGTACVRRWFLSTKASRENTKIAKDNARKLGSHTPDEGTRIAAPDRGYTVTDGIADRDSFDPYKVTYDLVSNL